MPSKAKLAAGHAARVAGLVLAAGRSARMGASTNKLTVEVDGLPLIAWPVEAMAGAGIQSPLVVTGFESEAVRAALAGRECVFSHHEDWRAGMGASLAFGVAQIMAEERRGKKRWDALLIGLGDLPGLRASEVEGILAAASSEAMQEQIVIPSFQGRRGHPVLFGRAFWPALAALSGDEGAKAILAAAGEAVVDVEAETDSILADLDTPEDLAAWRARKG